MLSDSETSASLEDESPSERAGYDRRMHRDEINELPIQRFTGPVTVVKDEEGLERAVKMLRREKVLGFDTETRPSFRKGQNYKTALLQLCGQKEAVLFQLNHTRFPHALRDLLADASIVKAGVAPDQDITKLKELGAFEPGGFVDISRMAEEAGIHNHGLRGLAAVLLGFRVSKRAQLSKWDRARLSPAQITYAATDAWVSREIFLALSGNHGG